MPLPIAHGLVGASIIAASRGGSSPLTKWKAILLGAMLAILPDGDLLFAWVFELGTAWHGSFSHSIAFAAAVGLPASLLTGRLRIREAAIFALATLSHGLLDACASKSFGGVELLWPVSSRRLKLNLFNYFEFYPSPATDSLGALLLRALEISVYELLIFAPIFIAVLYLGRRRQREDR
ncbi:MAG TPA: metal-dependent hydrolase [Blastocatellia bacterium]|nr:metal-dependent hydrolase [Blastocatellia bacterium]